MSNYIKCSFKGFMVGVDDPCNNVALYADDMYTITDPQGNTGSYCIACAPQLVQKDFGYVIEKDELERLTNRVGPLDVLGGMVNYVLNTPEEPSQLVPPTPALTSEEQEEAKKITSLMMSVGSASVVSEQLRAQSELKDAESDNKMIGLLRSVKAAGVNADLAKEEADRKKLEQKRLKRPKGRLLPKNWEDKFN